MDIKKDIAGAYNDTKRAQRAKGADTAAWARVARIPVDAPDGTVALGLGVLIVAVSGYRYALAPVRPDDDDRCVEVAL